MLAVRYIRRLDLCGPEPSQHELEPNVTVRNRTRFSTPYGVFGAGLHSLRRCAHFSPPLISTSGGRFETLAEDYSNSSWLAQLGVECFAGRTTPRYHFQFFCIAFA